jgi:hypothetical protein
MTFSNLHYLESSPPVPSNAAPNLQMNASGFSASQTIGVTWIHRDGVRGYTIASFDTNAQGEPTTIRVFRQAEKPAGDIILTVWNGHQSIRIGNGVSCR